MEFSLRYPPVQGRLHTRYAPVRRSSAEYCYSLLPLDLHVLSLPLAFILSQDQTLHCKNCLFYLLTRLRVTYISIYVSRHTLSLSSHLFQTTVAFFQPPFFRRKRMQRYNHFPNCKNIFSKKFSKKIHYYWITVFCTKKNFSSFTGNGTVKMFQTLKKKQKKGLSAAKKPKTRQKSI